MTRVLIVEDSPTQAAALAMTLTDAGYEVSEARTGEEALGMMAAEAPDVVVSDIVMPGVVDGYELCRRIKREHPALPIMLLTSLSDPLDIIRGLEVGADNFVTKPYDARLLVRRLEALINTRDARSRARLRMGVKVVFMGREFTITSDREQILDLLMSTFEEAVVQNRVLRERELELEAARAALARHSRTLEDRLQGISDSVPDVLYSASPDWNRFEYVSAACENVFGCAPDAMTREYWEAHVHPEDLERALVTFEEALSTGLPTTREYRFRLSNDRVRWITETIAPVRSADGAVARVDGIARDITEQRRLQEQFQQAQKMESVGRLAGGVAHDFNNLLTVILGETGLLLVEPPADPRICASLEDVRAAAERASGLTRQLLMFSRQEFAEPTLVEVNDAARSIIKMVRRLIGEDISLNVLEAPEPAWVRIDRGQLEQVMMNLLVNSRDAMPEGGILTVETSVASLDETYARQHAGVAPGKYVRLEISDSGVGMPPEVKAHLFEPFFTTKERGRGTGLGLATCYGIVKGAGGHITVYSEVGVGTTAMVFLPWISESGRTVRAAASTKPLRGQETILLVEDEPAVRGVATRVLEVQGYRVLPAGDANEAIRILEEEGSKVDLLLTDLVMPGISGRVLADKAREMFPALPVLFASGYTADVAVRHRLVEQRDPVVHKPFTAESLGRKVRDVLDGTGGQAESA